MSLVGQNPNLPHCNSHDRLRQDETGGCQLRVHPEPTGQRRAIITEAERTARHVGRAGRLLKIAVTHLQELKLLNPLHYL